MADNFELSSSDTSADPRSQIRDCFRDVEDTRRFLEGVVYEGHGTVLPSAEAVVLFPGLSDDQRN